MANSCAIGVDIGGTNTKVGLVDLECGEILEQGSHGELLARRGRYHELFSQQSLRDITRGSAWSDDGDGAYSM